MTWARTVIKVSYALPTYPCFSRRSVYGSTSAQAPSAVANSSTRHWDNWPPASSRHAR